jgi:hypothetical protein
MAEPKKVNRWDSYEPGRWMTTSFTRTTDGFLQGRAVVTSVGVFTYRHQDGSVTQELRLPEDVFATDSLASMKLKPVTNNHPTEKVTPDNTQELAVGSLGSNPSSTAQEYDWNGKYTPLEKLTDGLHVAIDMTINRADAIDDVVNGKRFLSMGYECDLEKADEGAVWCGMAYSHIQRNIRYNHCAIVDKARAGDAAQIHLDSADAVLENSSTPKEGSEMGMKTIRIDGVDYQGEETLVVKYTELVKRADAAEKALEKANGEHKDALSKMEAERDTAKDRADKAEADLKKAKEDSAVDEKRLDELVSAKLAVLNAADRAGVEVKADMSDADIKKAVITAVFPTSKLDGKDEVYLSARFDSAVEILESRADGESRAVAGDPPSKGETRTDSVAARQRMIDYNNRRSRGDTKEE